MTRSGIGVRRRGRVPRAGHGLCRGVGWPRSCRGSAVVPAGGWGCVCRGRTHRNQQLNLWQGAMYPGLCLARQSLRGGSTAENRAANSVLANVEDPRPRTPGVFVYMVAVPRANMSLGPEPLVRRPNGTSHAEIGSTS